MKTDNSTIAQHRIGKMAGFTAKLNVSTFFAAECVSHWLFIRKLAS